MEANVFEDRYEKDNQVLAFVALARELVLRTKVFVTLTHEADCQITYVVNIASEFSGQSKVPEHFSTHDSEFDF